MEYARNEKRTFDASRDRKGIDLITGLLRSMIDRLLAM